MTSFAGSYRQPGHRVHAPNVTNGGAAEPTRGNQTDITSSGGSTISSASNASLNGAYNFTFTGPHDDSWGQTLNCGGNLQFWGGSETRDQTVLGTANFDGAGNVSGTFTQYGKFDQTSSNNTVSCGNNGSAVYFSPCSGTFTGTYSLQSNGSGTMTLTPTGGCPGSGGNPNSSIIQLAGACSSGLSNTLYMINFRTDNSVESSGIGRYTSTC
jgi:hypothetical protein